MEILFFTQETCTPCKAVKKFIELNGLETDNIREIVLEDERDLFGEYGVQSTPTLMLVNELGIEVVRVSGMNPQAIKSLIERANG